MIIYVWLVLSVIFLYALYAGHFAIICVSGTHLLVSLHKGSEDWSI